MALAEGDVVRFDYVLTLKGEAKPLETSQEAVAKAQGIHRDDKRYRPLTVTIGGRNILPGLEEQIRKKAAKGATLHVELAAKDAYGERDPSAIKDIPMAQFRRQKVDPRPGMLLQYEGRRALVARVAGGRVRLDLNHELAGRALVYDIEVREVLTDPEAKVRAVVEDLFGGTAKVRLDDDAVELEVPEQVKFDQQWPMAKFQVVAQLRQAVGVDKVIRLVETFPPMPAPQSTNEEE